LDLKLDFFRASRVKLGALEDLDPRKVTVIGWQARCEVHDQFTVSDIENVRKQFPDVVILAHPECSPEVIEKCDHSGSTKQMIEQVRTIAASKYLLLTECSMADNIAAENPDKDMLRLCSIRCPHMNQITLEETLASLQQIRYKIELPDDIIHRARLPIDRMLEIR
jgi:quinolinate synthase